jgi:hypothetical protein
MSTMDVYIHRDAVGLSQHLLCQANTGKILKVKDLPDTPLIYGMKSLNEVAELHAIPLPPFPPPAHAAALQTALAGQDVPSIPWSLTMPSSAFVEAVKGLGKYLIDHFSSLDLTYYQTHYQQTWDVFEQMRPAKIDPMAWKVFGEDPKATAVIRSFEPDQLGFAQEVVYSRSTKTGRMKVVSGPQILALQESKHSLVTSRFGKEGKVFSLDFRSLEPRVALALGNPSTISTNPPFPSPSGYLPLPPTPTPSDDLYADIAKKLGIQDISRDVMKEVILSQLYGAGQETIISRLHSVRDAEGLIDLVTDYFKLTEMKARLRAENEANGRTHILNHYGRWVDTSHADDYMLLNYFIQSTAVDVALYGFKNMLQAIGTNPLIVPLFLRHDEIVLDVHRDAEALLPSLCAAGSRNIPLFPGVSFSLGISRF